MVSNARVVINLWVTLLAIWLLANASLDSQVVLTGVLLATLLSLGLAGFSSAYAEVRLSPQVLVHYVLYLLVFSAELLRANLNVARLVFSPRIDIHPGIVEIKTKLKSRTGRMVLANSITLTPGTITVSVNALGKFAVHSIDRPSGEALPGEMETRIAEVFEE